jgi:hypothetical protein
LAQLLAGVYYAARIFLPGAGVTLIDATNVGSHRHLRTNLAQAVANNVNRPARAFTNH